jgi:hypothetical protein
VQMETNYPAPSDRRQGVEKSVEVLVAAIPVVGSTVQILFNEVMSRKLSDRRMRWLNELAEMVFDHADRIGSLEALVADDTFVDAVVRATEIAGSTSNAQKLAMLRIAVIHSVSPGAPGGDRQQLFFDLIMRFTVTQVRLLKLASDPSGWFQRAGLQRPPAQSGRWAVVAAAMPDLAHDQDVVVAYYDGLLNARLAGGWVSSRRVRGTSDDRTGHRVPQFHRKSRVRLSSTDCRFQIAESRAVQGVASAFEQRGVARAP